LGYQGTTFSDLDFIASGFLIGKAGQLGPIAATIFVFGVLAVMIAVSVGKSGKEETK